MREAALASRRTLELLRGESGLALTTEFVGWLPLLLVTGLCMWQTLLYAWSATAASNAARTASRAEARGGDGVAAGRRSLDPALRGGASVRVTGETAIVHVRVPVIAPGWDSSFEVTGTATLPRDGL
ncbi:MAG TPA: TadE/TadG family type IV pilus assembly protein [Thermoleophilaceae bacterium]|jgi:hypothetical protein